MSVNLKNKEFNYSISDNIFIIDKTFKWQYICSEWKFVDFYCQKLTQAWNFLLIIGILAADVTIIANNKSAKFIFKHK